MTIRRLSNEKAVVSVIPRSVSQRAMGDSVESSYNQSPIADATEKYSPFGENATSRTLPRPNRAIAPFGSIQVVTSLLSKPNGVVFSVFLLFIKMSYRMHAGLRIVYRTYSYCVEKRECVKPADGKTKLGKLVVSENR